MSKAANPKLVGVFVLGAIALTIGVLAVLGGGKLFQRRTPVVMFFQGSVTGLNVGSPVNFRGVRVGQVTGVFTGDECLAGKLPIQGTELCAVADYMYSLEHLLAILGDPAPAGPARVWPAPLSVSAVSGWGGRVLLAGDAALLRLYLLRRDPGWLEDGEFERLRFPLALVAAFVAAK